MLRTWPARKFKYFLRLHPHSAESAFAIVYSAYPSTVTPSCLLPLLGCDALSVAFGFAVIHEVFVDVFRPSTRCAIWARCYSSGLAW